MHSDILVLGSGPAGFSAGLYAGRAGFLCTLLTGPEKGGKLLLTDRIENYPGTGLVSGYELAESMEKQALNAGVNILNETATNLNLSTYPFEIQTEKSIHTAQALIIAMGTTVKWLNLPNEHRFKGRGISVCATCDGFFYKNKHVAVIGGGGTAVYEALHLAKIASKVTVITPNTQLNGERVLLNEIKKTPNIFILTNTRTLDFIGENKLTALKLQKTGTSAPFALPVDGCFEAIGFTPTTTLFGNQLQLNAQNYIHTNCLTRATNIPGVYACGDIQETTYRQAILAASSGAQAALNATNFLGFKTYPNNPSYK